MLTKIVLLFFTQKDIIFKQKKTKASYCITTDSLKDCLPKNCKPLIVDPRRRSHPSGTHEWCGAYDTHTHTTYMYITCTCHVRMYVSFDRMLSMAYNTRSDGTHTRAGNRRRIVGHVHAWWSFMHAFDCAFHYCIAASSIICVTLRLFTCCMMRPPPPH